MKTLKEVIKERAMSEKAFEAGVTYYNEKKVKNLQMKEEQMLVQGGISVDAEVEGNFKIPYCVNFVAWNSQGHYRIGYEHCNCPAYQKYNGICKHIVATALELMNNQTDWLREQENATDQNAMTLIKSFREKNRWGGI